MKRRLFILTLIGCLIPAIGLCQTSMLVGQVYDSHSGEPLPNISVYISGTDIGTATNDEGYFLLRTQLKKRSRITVSGIGYHTEHLWLEPGQSAGTDIGLKEKDTQLADIFVTPGKNPALALMARVRQARNMNDVPADERTGAETELYLSNIQAKHLNRHIWRSLQQGLIATEDSAYLLPLYRFQEKDGHQQAQAAMLTETDYAMLLSEWDRPIDFYKNSIPVYSTSFLSPLAADGNNFYTYYLSDSTEYTDSNATRCKVYEVHFKTKNPYYNTFNGTMRIDSASAAIVSVQAVVPAQVNANYLHRLDIRQTYDSVTHQLIDENISLLMDFAVKTDTAHLFPTVWLLNRKRFSPTAVAPSGLALPADTFTQALEQLQSTPLIRTAKFFAYVIQNAYIPTGGKIEIGNVSEIIHINPQETVRLGIPIRTAPSLWKNVCLEGYVAYGVGDKAWKGMGTVWWNLPTQRRNMLQFRYADEYIYSDVSDFDRMKWENAVWSPQMGITTAMMKCFYQGNHTYNSMARQREGRIQLESDWTDRLETRLRLSVGRLGYGEPTHDYAAQPSFLYAKLGAVFRLSWQEKKVDYYCHRMHAYNHLPVLYIGGEIGSYQLDGMSHYDVYGNLNLMLRHHLPLGAGGELDYLLEGGIVLGRVPYPLLHVFEGNQSYAYDPNRFTLMHNYQFAADKYVQLQMHWNGQGCLFNLIPGIRVLRLRELVSFKMAYGGLNNRHAERLAFPVGYMQPLTTPYVEIGVGLGNILRIADLMSVWRLTHRDDPGAPKWSMRFRFHLDN
ncbi:MAG: DUF5686 and carboxypeptidase regulatory-like domain-containing protein [Paludibacteraceae bacterium]|nr:DUF5686 and carboxypeptidase regulatory-like domain-containing protein [Paludibacteraceae bacterium]